MEFFTKIIDDGSYCITGCRGSAAHIVIPAKFNVTVLYDNLFKGHTGLESVVIPDTVTNIGGFVFDGCENLKELSLPPALTDMWQYALARCGIETIEIPEGVSSILPFTFNECRSLKEVTINSGTKRICAWAFKDCTALKNVYLKGKVEDISVKAFEGCKGVSVHQL